MLKKLEIKNGKIAKNSLTGESYEVEYFNFIENEEVLELNYGDYTIKVIFKKKNVFKVLITRERSSEVVVKQEVGDYESLCFTIQNYIDLLASFKEYSIKK